ncbi:MAG: neutral zinc metallopeptidase [Bacteroidales bacterium]|nr:neutral zinc metallopeptidase [Bacteroidales bacterium]
MKLDGRRESTNVEDRRRAGGTIAGVLGGGGIIAIIITLVSQFLGGGGGGIGDVLGQLVGQVIEQKISTSPADDAQFTEEEQALAKISRQILASTEDVWTAEFQKHGLTYRNPTLVLYTGTTSTGGCGTGQSAMGPFYCSADEKLYVDLSFFSSMKQQLGVEGTEFVYAYVIAHEVGHHIENLRGDLAREHKKMKSMSQKEANKRSVRIELQADYYAGVWAYHENKNNKSLEAGDVDRALDCARKIGDDYLQKKGQGYVVEDSFTHGTAEQRKRWLEKGLRSGDMNGGDTYSISENQL